MGQGLEERGKPSPYARRIVEVLCGRKAGSAVEVREKFENGLGGMERCEEVKTLEGPGYVHTGWFKR